MTNKSYAKVNIFLKIIGIKDNYHLISSRFMVVNSLYDTISFEKKEKDDKNFELIGKFSCTKEQNIIYKAYKKLLHIDKNTSKKIENFFISHKVVVKKNIPEFAGLGGGSSNAATFLKMCDKFIGLGIKKDILLSLSNTLGADVTFFVSNYDSANVSGIGEKVEKFNEHSLNLNISTPPIKCETSLVYKEFRSNLMKNYHDIINNNKKLSQKLSSLKSPKILDTFDKEELNDLYIPACTIYPDLKKYGKKGWFFSGSGSSFFRREDG